jgi:hypothetical protein
MMEPLPNCLSICARAASIALARSFLSSIVLSFDAPGRESPPATSRMVSARRAATGPLPEVFRRLFVLGGQRLDSIEM